MLYNDVMHPINIAWLVYDVLRVTISSFIPETVIRKRVKRSSRKNKNGEEEDESEQDQRSHHNRSHHRSHHRRSGISSQPPSVNTSLNASAFASGELPPQVPHRSRSHSGGRHSKREKSSTSNINTRRWRDWRNIDLTKQMRLLAHILRATPVALLHFLCQYKTDVATLPLLRYSDLNNNARSLLWFNEDAVFASGVVVAFTMTRVLLYALQQYVRERLLFETNLVVRSLRSRRAWRNTFGWALTIGAHTLTDPIAFSTVACMLLVRRGNFRDLREVKFTPAGILAAGAVGCAGVFVDIVFTPVAVQLCQCGVVRVFDAAEYLLLRRYAAEALEYEEEDEDEDGDDDENTEYEDDHHHAIVNNNNNNNNNNKNEKNHTNNGDVGGDINGSRHKNSHNDDDDKKKKEEGDDDNINNNINKSRNNHHNSNNNSLIEEEEEEKRKERRERRRQQREMGGSNVNSEDENGTTERSHLSHKRHRTPSSKRESHNTSKSHPLTDDSDNERPTEKANKKGNSSIISSGRPREKSKAERRREREEERNGKARKAEERAILRAIIYRVVASLFAQCIVQHPLTVLSHMLYNRAVLHGVGLLTAYDAVPNAPLTLHACLQFIRFSGRNYNNTNGEQNSGVFIVEVLRSMGYFIGHEVSTVGGSIRHCSSQDAAIHALVEKAEETRRNSNNSSGTNIGNRALAMESAELMARSIASLSPLFTAFHFTAIDKLLGFYMAVWVRLNDK